jgi:small subunit ribosomal protein S11
MIIKLICSNNNTRLILTSFNEIINDRKNLNRSKFEVSVPKFSNEKKFENSINGSWDARASARPSKTLSKLDHNSTIIFQLTTGMVGFKGATRSSIYGGENLYKKFIERLKAAKLYDKTFVLLVKGFGPTRHYLLHKLAQLKIRKIQEITSYPHNGCRLPKSLRK